MELADRKLLGNSKDSSFVRSIECQASPNGEITICILVYICADLVMLCLDLVMSPPRTLRTPNFELMITRLVILSRSGLSTLHSTSYYCTWLEHVLSKPLAQS